ncbi:hypothetical protein L2E82_36105 [Cichorium intybus]|uniref:Uncharacterized protein n=1 Tax=Cichorium intybus TaxID=13427 RepID=A0ACB9BQL8_CICIN|nr:hypothetical protein L2E82_36105 [Cichorium intybus]
MCTDFSNWQKGFASHADRDVSVDISDVYHEEKLIKHDKKHRRHTDKEKVKREDKEKEHHLQNRNSDHHESNRVNHKRKSTNTLEESATQLFHQNMRDQVVSVREKLKERLQNSDC